LRHVTTARGGVEMKVLPAGSN